MNRSFKQKVAALAAVAAVIAGGTVAAMTATGQGPTHSAVAARPPGHRVGSGDLRAAAGYLGLSAAQLQGDLQSGRTLAQVAGATSGKSAAGLIDALVARKKARLAAAAATLPERVTAEVNRVGAPRLGRRGAGRGGAARGIFFAPGYLGFAAASYLGMTAPRLQADLQSGQTLAHLANATSGKSAAGLIDALVAAKKEALAVRIAAGNLTQAKEDKLAATLPKRVTALVNRRGDRRPLKQVHRRAEK